MRSERSGELNALGFSARKSGSKPVEGEVIEANFIEKLQARPDFFEDFLCNRRLCGGQNQGGKKSASFFYCELAEFGDRAACDANGPRFRAKTSAAAVRAGGITAIAAEKNAHV